MVDKLDVAALAEGTCREALAVLGMGQVRAADPDTTMNWTSRSGA
jgi:hypothetical protein